MTDVVTVIETVVVQEVVGTPPTLVEVSTPGPQGVQGIPGPTGATGAAGSAGAQGPAGATGPQGSTGSTGAAGTNGAPGAVWRNGSGAPSNSLGVDGDYYLNTATDDVYFRSSGSYSIVVNIRGSAGAAGATGLTGPQGPAGSNGATGSAGAPGSVWRDGSGVPSNSLGADGDYYLDDATGNVYLRLSGAYSNVANIKGPTGVTGATGPTGATGSTGATGPAPAGTGYVHVTAGSLDIPSATIPATDVATDGTHRFATDAEKTAWNAKADAATTVNGQPLTSNVTLSASDVGAPSGSGTSSGFNSGDQTITLTGDVTGSGTGSFAATIAAGSVTLAKQANVATGTLFYRKTAGAGAPEVQTLATLKTDLSLTGTNSGDQTITLTGDVTGSGTGSFAATIAAGSVSYAKIQDISATSRILGRITAGAGSAEELTAANVKTILSLVSSDVGLGSVTNDAQTKATVVPNTVPSSAQILVGNAGGTAYAPVSLTGPVSITAAGLTAVATLNQSTTGSAATLTIARAIYGNNFDGHADLTQIIASTYGGTGNGFTKFSGPATAEKTFTLPNASATLLYDGGALGTPPSGTLTNCTGLPAAGVVGTAAILGLNVFTRLQTYTQGTANEGIFASTGYSLTGSSAVNMIDLAGTLNTTGNPIAINVALTNTASGATTKFLSFNAGAAGATNIVNIDLLGKVQSNRNGASSGNGLAFSILVSGQNEIGIGRNSSVGGLNLYGGSGTTDGTGTAVVLSDRIALNGANYLSWCNGAVTQTVDTFFGRSAAATIQQGAANAASPVAQTLQAQGSRSGTDSNVGGANYTVASGKGTGTGTLSSLVLQSPVAVASGTGAQTLTTGLTIKAGVAILQNYTVANLPAASTVPYGTAVVTDASTTLVLGLGGTVTGGGANKVPVYSDGTNWIYG